MEEFNTSLVREKIVFIDDEANHQEGHEKEPVVIRSNRVFLSLGKAPAIDKVVIRAQNMHVTLRLAAKILLHYYRHGPFDQSEPVDWEEQWDMVLSAYEKTFNPNVWAAVYINGKPVFKTMTSPFVDIIEKCALLTIDNYDATMEVTENALKKIGHAMRINHSSSVAAVITDTGDLTRSGIIHRTGKKDTTFSYTGTGANRQNRIVQSLDVAAAYLEVFNLHFMIQTLQKQVSSGQKEKTSTEGKQLRAAILRQGSINKVVSAYEALYDVKYRPAKPDLFSNI